MTGGQIALVAGVGLVGLAVVYKIAKTQAIVPTTNPTGAGSAGINGSAPGSSTGTGSSLTKAGQVGSKILTGSSSGGASGIGKTALATAVLGPSYELYNAGKTFIGYL